MLFSKLYNRTNNLGIQNKNNFFFILKQLPLPKVNEKKAKDLTNYQNREVQKNEQVPINIKMSDDEFVTPTMVSVNNTVDENAVKQRAAKRKILEK